MAVSIFDDGSSLTTDNSGAVVAATDNSGSAVPVAPPDTGIAQQFFNIITNGVNGLIQNKVAPAPAPQVGPNPPAPAGVTGQLSTLFASPTVRTGGLLLAGYLLYKKFA